MVAQGESFAAALKLANQVAEQSPSSVAACKTLIQKGRHQPMANALPQERELFVGLFDLLNVLGMLDTQYQGQVTFAGSPYPIGQMQAAKMRREKLAWEEYTSAG